MRLYRWLLFIIAVAAISFSYLYIKSRWPDPIGQVAPSAQFIADDTKKHDGEASGRYKGLPEGAVILDDTSPAVKEEIRFWQERITRFAEVKAPEMPNQEKIHEFALLTASLVRLLKEARERELKGLDPFTGASGFNTMALFMTLETEFENRLGCSFSHFFASQGHDELKFLLMLE